MNQENKQLLLKDLCARLPYGVRARFCDGVKDEIDDVWDIDMFSGAINADYIIDDVKPYLRLLSSMTEEEKKEYHSVIIESQNCSFENSESSTTKVNDWLLSKHFDVRGLIKKGLALEASENMYKTE